jgi:L-lactate dehydrogenase complex protein LldE
MSGQVARNTFTHKKCEFVPCKLTNCVHATGHIKLTQRVRNLHGAEIPQRLAIARGERIRVTITLFIPCFVDLFFPRVGISMVQILQRLGHTVIHSSETVCCGQPPFNSGYWDQARSIALNVLQKLESAEAIAVPSGSCATMLKIFYPQLFADTPHAPTAAAIASRTWEFSDLLVNKLGVSDVAARFAAKVTYHDGCHALRELGIRSGPRKLLSNVRDLELIEMTEAQTCCGFGGMFCVEFPMISTAMGEVKCAAAVETDAQYIVSGDSSCLMHLQGLLARSGSKIKTIHLAEVLAQQ